jgi:hypothetical protein
VIQATFPHNEVFENSLSQRNTKMYGILDYNGFVQVVVREPGTESPADTEQDVDDPVGSTSGFNLI